MLILTAIGPTNSNAPGVPGSPGDPWGKKPQQNCKNYLINQQYYLHGIPINVTINVFHNLYEAWLGNTWFCY